MSSLVLLGDTSGQITLAAPATAGTTTLTLQANTGTLALQTDGIGFSQTWQDVTASRVSGTTYYNTTGRPIFILPNPVQSTSQTTNASINGVVVLQMSGSGNSFQYIVPLVIPVGASYSCTANGGFTRWFELR
jgi:hypothetical protein